MTQWMGSWAWVGAVALALGLTAGAGAATERGRERAPARTAPPLLVVFTVDGLPMRQVEALRARFAPDGLRRFLDRGVVFQQALYTHAHTVTCAGHATLATGAPPAVHGLISNEWIDAGTQRVRYCLADPEHRVLGEGAGTSGTSPRALLAEALADVLLRERPGAKVFSVSGKDRGAIPAAGQHGVAYWYQPDLGTMATSSYYMAEPPAWVLAYNRPAPALRFQGARWQPLLSEADCRPCAPDGSPWMSNASFGNRLPATLEAGARFTQDLPVSPFGDQLVLDFALELQRQEGLGGDGRSDLLAISLSSHDAISHAFGPESRLALDHLLQLDQMLQGFFQALDRRVGQGRWAAALSADHGFLDSPEWRQQQGQPGGRFNSALLIGLLNERLAASLGPGRWVLGLSASGLMLDDARLAREGRSREAVAEQVAALAREIEPVQAAYGPKALRGGETEPRHLAALRASWHPERSAPVMLALGEGWMFGSSPRGATHGSPHRYDQHVPLLFWGPAWVPQGRAVARPVRTLDFAPTLAALLGLPAPAQSQGQALPEALRMRPN